MTGRRGVLTPGARVALHLEPFGKFLSLPLSFLNSYLQ